MGRVADTTAARGFQALRLRYVRRAGYLAMQSDYRNSARRLQRQWNEEFPEYRVAPDASDINTGPPARLVQDTIEGIRRRTAEIEAIISGLGGSGEPDSYPRVDMAIARWVYLIAGGTHKWFPPDDFPNPYTGARAHPGSRFIQASMYADPRLIDLESVFPAFTLSPEVVPALPETGPDLQFHERMWSGGGMIGPGFLYLPLYPGLTVSDLRAAEQAIVSRVAEHFRDHTTEARIRFHRAKGCGPQEIANLLGLTPRNVSRVLSANGSGAHGN